MYFLQSVISFIHLPSFTHESTHFWWGHFQEEGFGITIPCYNKGDVHTTQHTSGEMRMISLLVVFHLVVHLVVDCIFLPGIAPRSFAETDPVKLYVSKLSSTKTQIPYDYYSLPYCRPSSFVFETENLGEVISGDHIENSIYSLEMKSDKTCIAVCSKTFSSKQKQQFMRAIDEEYTVHWIVDNLPIGRYTSDKALGEATFTRGFPVGFTIQKKGGIKHYLYNHVRIIIQYHDDVLEEQVQTSKIVGFRVEPMSIHHEVTGNAKDISG